VVEQCTGNQSDIGGAWTYKVLKGKKEGSLSRGTWVSLLIKKPLNPNWDIQ